MANKKWYGKFFVMMGLVVCVGTAFSSLTGCTTTHTITFTGSEHPTGAYKYAVFPASSWGGSVLQRFYAQYPKDKYELVACERQSKNFLPVVAGVGGGLIGALVSYGVVSSLGDVRAGTMTAEGVMSVGVSTSLLGAIGYLIGDYFKDTYIITYIEKSSPPTADELMPEGDKLSWDTDAPSAPDSDAPGDATPWSLSIMGGDRNIGGTWRSNIYADRSTQINISGSGSTGTVIFWGADGRQSTGSCSISGETLTISLDSGPLSGVSERLRIVNRNRLEYPEGYYTRS